MAPAAGAWATARTGVNTIAASPIRDALYTRITPFIPPRRMPVRRARPRGRGPVRAPGGVTDCSAFPAGGSPGEKRLEGCPDGEEEGLGVLAAGGVEGLSVDQTQGRPEHRQEEPQLDPGVADEVGDAERLPLGERVAGVGV